MLPLFHIHGLSFAAHLSLISVSTMILEDRFHPLKTMESAVIGIPDPVKREKVMAVIVPEAGGKMDIDELKKHCREKLVNYQCPVSFEIVEELPRNTIGKVLKRELKEKFTINTTGARLFS
jgi:acyl-CoA synthetase (AMP-forming)/AMP-acid ligase II